MTNTRIHQEQKEAVWFPFLPLGLDAAKESYDIIRGLAYVSVYLRHSCIRDTSTTRQTSVVT